MCTATSVEMVVEVAVARKEFFAESSYVLKNARFLAKVKKRHVRRASVLKSAF